MTKGIKEKDIRDFQKYAEKLNEVMSRIREYAPDANGFLNGDELCLMSGDWREGAQEGECDHSEKLVAYVDMTGFDGGAW